MKMVPLKKYFKIFLFVFIFLIGILLRIHNEIHQDFAFTYDVGRDLLALHTIVVNHKISLIGFTTGLQGVFYGPWWYLFLLPAFLISGGNPSAIVLFMGLIGITTYSLAFILGKKIGGSFLGLILMGFFAVSPILVAYSSQIWNPNIAPLFVFLTIFILYLIYKKDKAWYFFFLGFIASLNIEWEIVFGSIFFIYTTIFTFIYFYKKLNLKKILLYISGLFIVLFPQILFDLRHNFLMTKSFMFFLSGKSDAVSKSFNFLNAYSILQGLLSYTLFNNNNLMATVFIIFISALSIYLVLIYKTKDLSFRLRRFFIFYSFLYLLFAYVILSLFRHAIYDHYFIGEPVIFIFLFVLIIYELFNIGSRVIKTIVIFVVIILSIINLNPINNIYEFFNTGLVGDASVYRNQIQIVNYVYQKAKSREFKINVYTPPVFDYTYKYLFLWYGNNKYKTQPNNKAKLDFYIIEPDPGFSDRIKAWLTYRKNDGKIINIKKFKSGITVQERD